MEGSWASFQSHARLRYVHGVNWQINSFNQWSVELGKQLAPLTCAALNSVRKIDGHDSSTRKLIADIRLRGGLST